jgi:acyl carrier protein
MDTDVTRELVYLFFENLLKEHLGEDIVLSADTNLRDDFDIDSLEFVELSIKLEKAFGVKLPNAEVRRCITPSDIVQLVLGAAAASKHEIDIGALRASA